MSMLSYLRFAFRVRKREITYVSFTRLYTMLPMSVLTLMALMVITGMIMNADRIDDLTMTQGIGTLVMIAVFAVGLWVWLKSAKHED